MRLGLITSNAGKFKEAQEYFKNSPISLYKIEEPYPEIQSDTLENVVMFALKYLSDKYDLFIIDDSGLFIEHFSGFPGVYSAYVFKTLGNDHILKLMHGVTNRNAYFKTVIGLAWNKEFYYFTGMCTGTIATEPRGKNGFGYDPIFIPARSNRTFAEMNVLDKNRISHRARAFIKLKKFVEQKIL